MTATFQPLPATLTAIETVHEAVRVFTFEHNQPMTVAPGQFAEILLPGIGSFPVSACGYVTAGSFQACIKQVGRVTTALFRSAIGDRIDLRGPFGHGFPLADLDGRDLLLIAGGLGIAPIRALLQAVQGRPVRSITLLYGVRRADDLLFLPELKALAASSCLRLLLAVEEPLVGSLPPLWCNGTITDLLDELPAVLDNTAVAVCGPPQMYAALLERLAESGIAAERIFANLERRMRCGVGQCGHCVAGGRYVCTEGPVFNLVQLRQMPGAIA